MREGLDLRYEPRSVMVPRFPGKGTDRRLGFVSLFSTRPARHFSRLVNQKS